MSDKKITDLQLRSNVNDDVSIPGDDGIQTYRVTAPQIATYALAKPRKIVYKTANYTAAPGDHIISCDASGGDFTLSLPTAVGIEGKVYKIKRTDSDYGNVLTIDAATTELIDGELTFLLPPQSQITLVSDGVGWASIDFYEKIYASVRVSNGAGYGSTNDKIRIFDVMELNVGSDITYATDAALGDSWTINRKGNYSMQYADYINTSGGRAAGVSVNATLLTTAISGLSYADGSRGYAYNQTGDTIRFYSITLTLDVGDVVRAHSYGDFQANQGNLQFFHITRVS